MLRATEGFTIIEVTIFLAISGLLLLMMFLGTGSLAARQRFTDSTDSLLTFFQSQYDEVLNGVNVRASSTVCGTTATIPGKSNCLLIGKLLTIRADSSLIQASYIISSTTDVSTELSDKDKLQKAGLQVVSEGQTTYELKWGALPYSTTRSQGATGIARDTVNSIAFIRMPDSGRIVQLYYRNTDYGSWEAVDLANQLTGDTGIKLDTAYTPVADATKASLAVCIKNDADFGLTSIPPRSAIIFSGGQGTSAITTQYTPGSLCNI